MLAICPGEVERHRQVSHTQCVDGFIELSPDPVIRKVGLPSGDEALDRFIPPPIKRLNASISFFFNFLISLTSKPRVKAISGRRLTPAIPLLVRR
jgi:hypothetical protein